MNKLQMLRAISEFLKRTPITGEEAETMVVCKDWLRQQEAFQLEPRTSGQANGPVGQNSGTPALQVAGTSGK